METYFGCQQLRQHLAQCPLKAANSTPAQSIASNKTAASGTRCSAPQNSRPLRRNALNFGQGCGNHVNAKEVQVAPDVVYGEVLVNSTSTTVLFDSDASHLFVSACLRIVLLPTPLLIRTLGAILKCTLKCP